ncbi:MAG: hypothetical protein ACRCXK_07350 [Wohlfahrtiimonas sp.]
MKKLLLAVGIIASTQLTLAQDLASEMNYYTTPLQVVIQDKLLLEQEELSTIILTQELSSVENPDQVIITLTETDLMDDSIQALQTTYDIKKDEHGWYLEDKEATYRCRRGKHTEEFTINLCP